MARKNAGRRRPPGAPTIPSIPAPPQPFLYDNFVVNVSRTFEAALSWMSVVHNFEYGSEFEVALCKILRPILPMKYGICRGYVVDINGNKEGDDIIIYDRMGFPTLRSLGGEDYSRKEQIPIEAVYAYIEAKHTLQLRGTGESSLQHAMDQVCKVKRLCFQTVLSGKTLAYLVI